MRSALVACGTTWALAFCAWSQIVSFNNSNQHTYVVSPSSGLEWASVMGRQFAHTWYRSSTGISYRVRPGEGPEDPPQQSDSFAYLGVNRLIDGRIHNSCVAPCVPPRSGDVVRTMDTFVGPHGANLSINGSILVGVSAAAWCRVEVSPYSTTGPVRLGLTTVASYMNRDERPSRWGFSKAYSTSGAELRTMPIPPAPSGTHHLTVSWQLAFLRARVVQSGSAPEPPPVYPTHRVWNQARYRVEHITTGEVEEGTLLTISAEAWTPGEVSFTPAVGLHVDSPDGLFEIVSGGGKVAPSGRFRVRTAGGRVVESEATGVLASAAVPPIGAGVPFTVWDLPVVLDHVVDVGRPTGPTIASIHIYHGGPDSAVTPIPADVNFDGVVDFNDLLEMLKLYFDEDPRADVTGDRVIDFNDLLAYLNQYNESI